MTSRTKPDNAALQLANSPELIDRNLRLCSFTVVNHFLEMQWVLFQQTGLRPAELLIVLATTMGNAQRIARPETLPDSLRQQAAVLPPNLIVPISRRAIARVTGLPKETVRRSVDRLVARGLLQETPKGIRAAPGMLAKKGAREAVHRLVELHAAYANVLIGQGILTARPSTEP